MRKRRRIVRRNTHEIDPDEVLLDASNLPSFDTHQVEGRIIAPIEKKTLLLFGFLVLGILFFFAFEAFFLQVVRGGYFKERSENNSLRQQTIFADRGVVTDRNGVPLIRNVVNTEDNFALREYETPGFSHLLGYVQYPRRDAAGFYFTTKSSGVAGVEKQFDAVLTGENGALLTETDARGNVASTGIARKPIPGKNITLSIDARVQRIFYNRIKELADRIPFSGGAGILMNVHTGEIIALASYPEFDSNVLANSSDAALIRSYQKNVHKPFLYRPVSGLYAPGSVVKPIVATAALETGIVTPETSFVSTGSISVPNPYNPNKPSVFLDWRANGVVNAARAIAVSSNIYFYIVGGGYKDQEGLGISRLIAWMKAFGLSEKTGINVPEEAQGFLPTPQWKEKTYNQPWRIGDTYYTAIGQYAVQVTPIQIIRAITAIANRGTLVTPTILKGGVGSTKTIPAKKKVFDEVVKGMKEGVRDGVARGLANPYVSVAAKTGTAQIGVLKNFHNSWVTGFFPADNPQYSFVIVMERGPSTNLVGGVSVMRNIIEDMAKETPEYFKHP